MQFAVRDGLAVPQDVYYPLFYLDMLNDNLVQANKQWRLQNPTEAALLFDRPCRLPSPEKMPFQLSPAGLEFNPAWAAFAPLSPRTKADSHSRDDAQRVVEMLRDGELPWDMRCSSIRPHTSLVAMCMYAVGRSMGALPGEDMHSNPMAPDMVLKGLKKANTTPQQLRDFSDGGLTLVDIATRYQCWDVAQWLWNKGVRWSDREIERGQPLLDMVVAYENCSRAVHGFSSPDYILRTRLPASQWFKNWFDRWEKSGGKPPQVAALDHAARLLEARGFKSSNFSEHPLVTPQQFFASRALLIGTSNKISLPINRAHSEHIACLQAWSEMWARNGVDILNLDYRQVLGGGRHEPITLGARLESVDGGQPWKDMIAAQISNAGLQASTGRAHPSGPPSMRF